MEMLFIKMGLEDAASEIFRSLERDLHPKIAVETIPPKLVGSQALCAVQEDDRHISFCSAPILLDGLWLRVVLTLNKFGFYAYYTLQRKKIAPGVETVVSLLDAAAQEYLRECPDSIRSFEGERLVVRLHRGADEMLRAAARRLLSNPATINGYGDGPAKRLFFDCNSISYLRYERGENTGHLVMARRGHPNVEEVLTRCSPLPMADHRAVRKLLELTSDELFVLGDGYQVYGLGRLTGHYNEEAQDLYSVRFIGQSHWEFYHGRHLMMRVLEGRPQLPDMKLEGRFRRSVRSLFPDLQRDAVAELWRLAHAAASARRGALLVISDRAESEARRLEKSCTRIEPARMTPELMRRVCAIDGAVLIDTSGVCHAIGAILDGMASQGGDPSRGARYNSAVRYSSSSRHPCLIAVVSEDGGMEVLSSPGQEREGARERGSEGARQRPGTTGADESALPAEI